MQSRFKSRSRHRAALFSVSPRVTGRRDPADISTGGFAIRKAEPPRKNPPTPTCCKRAHSAGRGKPQRAGGGIVKPALPMKGGHHRDVLEVELEKHCKEMRLRTLV
ncbi:hypothetical protein NDU88_006879 [Pleurodeles waltl]|uniref:Uncharacterized protein n=1 Tax=Pleurodeles waltl TaxID=8319 RepID=A0AAV7MG89_PLEWA|nr:hypothetical protein NDU88_006879 [Pleurodeles waltl]